ncbi:MAG: alpha/beta fold hydrolase [Chloroflexota bacterium]|nr:alpha/beta fold hydrolase [Chloroflexota bacterium]
MYRIEALLSARLFLRPEIIGDKIFFLSNLSGHNSLYSMNHGGSVPEPLLPPNIVLQNPHLIGGESFAVFKGLGKILVMIDQDGDENYLPMEILITGGFPEPAFDNFFENTRCHLGYVDAKLNLCYISAESREEGMVRTYLCRLDSGEIEEIYASPYGGFPGAMNKDYSRLVIIEGYMVGDSVAYLWEKGLDPKVLYGKPIEEREEGEEVPLNAFGSGFFTDDDKGVVFENAIFQDTYGLGYLSLDAPENVIEVPFEGLEHKGLGEFQGLEQLENDHFLLEFNIDGASWAYEAEYDQNARVMRVLYTLVGKGTLSEGVLEAVKYDEEADRFVLAFSTAKSPTQIYTVEGNHRDELICHTNESILGIPEAILSPGEDYSYETFDGLRVSARLYMPSEKLGFAGKRPVVYYLHGGPQGQERPDFSWFSMPLIQFLTLQGFAVFVPNVRGSTGYGLSYTKQVDRDWGGQDRLDHVYAMTAVLPNDDRLDVKRAGVVGRSYGGYMTLTMAGRHPELWAAAVDMFGPYDLITFSERIPPTWKPYFNIALGNPENPDDVVFLKERSPKTYIENIKFPMLVIQGRNDPRVVAEESEDLVKHLQDIGKDVKLLLFENEGHGVEKYENKVTCYNAIMDFFVENLMP